jgi:tRNA(His) 5'-end guanylyltransferase
MDIGDRMKAYENTFRYHLPIRMPVIIRIDGKAFHTLTRNCEKPFDHHLSSCLDAAAMYLVEEIRGRAVTSGGVDDNIPIFSEDRAYIEKFLEIEDK